MLRNMLPMEWNGMFPRRNRRATLLCGIFLVFLPNIWPDTVNAEQLSISFDQSLAYEGNGEYGFPGHNGVNDVVPPVPPVRMRLNGEIENGDITADPEGFAVEPGSVPIVFFESYFDYDWKAVSPVSGTYVEETGKMTLDLDLEQTVTYGSSSCSVGPIPVTLSTELATEAGSGRRFTEGLDGPGALVGRWDSVPKPAGSNCDLRQLGCLARHSLLKGPGAFGIARGGIELTASGPRNPDQTVDKFGVAGYEDEGGCLGKRPDPGPGPDPAPDPEPKLMLTVERVKSKPRKARFKVKVRSTGGDAVGIRICARAFRGPRLRSPACQEIGALSAGATASRGIAVVLSKNRKKRRRQLRQGRVKVSAVAEGMSAKSVTRLVWVAKPKS